jgi:hypothetical protein
MGSSSDIPLLISLLGIYAGADEIQLKQQLLQMEGSN